MSMKNLLPDAYPFVTNRAKMAKQDKVVTCSVLKKTDTQCMSRNTCLLC